MSKYLMILLTLFRMWGGGGGGGVKQFFPRNFYKRRNLPPKLSDI